MYSREYIDELGYFEDVDMDHLSDSLTGVIARKYILEYARELVNHKKPFTMFILDIDNFKDFNDSFGHIVGDECLISIGKSLMDFVNDKGLVGRFGGDEFIILYFGNHSYEEAHQFASSLYGENSVVRRTYQLNDAQLFVTATVGNASFPRDTETYDDLFKKVDKALYRGKTKGRNCYITYVKEKHEHIDVHKKDETSLRMQFKTLEDITKLNESSDQLIKHMLDSLTSIIGVSESLFVKPDGYAISSEKEDIFMVEKSIVQLINHTDMSDELFSPENIEEYRKSTLKEINDWINKEEILTFFISEIRSKETKFGNIVLIEKNVRRIWQDRDAAIVMFMDRLIENLFISKR